MPESRWTLLEVEVDTVEQFILCLNAHLRSKWPWLSVADNQAFGGTLTFHRPSRLVCRFEKYLSIEPGIADQYDEICDSIEEAIFTRAVQIIYNCIEFTDVWRGPDKYQTAKNILTHLEYYLVGLPGAAKKLYEEQLSALEPNDDDESHRKNNRVIAIGSSSIN